MQNRTCNKLSKKKKRAVKMTFSSLILIFLVFALILAASKFLPSSKNPNKNFSNSVGLPYVATGRLFSIAERSFLGVLDDALGADFRVFGKVRVGDVARVKPGLGRSASQGALNKIAYKHFDYIICSATDLAIVCAVELNDQSHSTKRAQARDDLIAGVCKVIVLPLMQVTARSSYSPQDVLDQFIDTIKQTITKIE